jgi:hypothetical protein
MPMRARFPILLAFLLAVGSAVAVSPARAQDREGGHHPGLFRNLRDRLIGRGGAEALREATLLPDAAAARDVMEGLAGRGGDDVVAARAAIWAGHYHYGAGDTEAALAWFEKARASGGGPAERAESDFWTAQCRNLLGRTQEGDAGGEGGGSTAVLASLARLDGELRVGRVESVLQGYLGLEREARRAGCLGPLLYRVGLVAASGTGGDNLGWSTVRAWAPACAEAPEYALVQAMQPTALRAAPPVPAASPDSGATPFAEAPGGAPNVPDAARGVSPDAGLPPATGRPAPSGQDAPPAADATPPEVPEYGAFCIQLGSFRDGERAAREARRLEGLGLGVRVEIQESRGEMWYRLRLGSFRTSQEAEETARARCTGLDWRVVRVEP